MFYNTGVKFSGWITQKYVEWRGDAIGNERSITDFARMIGVTQQLMNTWMSGATPKSLKSIQALVLIFGDEVYDVLGLERPAPAEPDIPPGVPPDMRETYLRDLEEFVDQWFLRYGLRDD